jgi:hypothetical protein
MAGRKEIQRSDISIRRGVQLQPIVTSWPDKVEKRIDDTLRYITSRYANGIFGSHRDTDGDAEGASRWSSTTESTGGSIDSSVGSSTGSSNNEVKSEYSDSSFESDDQKTQEERLDRLRQYYSSRPLMRCLDKSKSKDKKHLGGLLVNQLPDEVQYRLSQIAPAKKRGQEHIRAAFWDDVRMQLRDDDSPVSEASINAACDNDNFPGHIEDSSSPTSDNDHFQVQVGFADSSSLSVRSNGGASKKSRAPSCINARIVQKEWLREVKEFLLEKKRASQLMMIGLGEVQARDAVASEPPPNSALKQEDTTTTTVTPAISQTQTRKDNTTPTPSPIAPILSSWIPFRQKASY